MNKKVLSVLVDNTSGVLNRIAGLFSRRGYNIDSLTVGETENPLYSRMTIVVTGDDDILEQIIKQITKLEDVKRVDVLEPSNSVTRELILVKIKTTPEQRQQVMAMTEIFRANIVDVAKESVMIEITRGFLNSFLYSLAFAVISVFVTAKRYFTSLERASESMIHLGFNRRLALIASA